MKNKDGKLGIIWDLFIRVLKCLSSVLIHYSINYVLPASYVSRVFILLATHYLRHNFH